LKIKGSPIHILLVDDDSSDRELCIEGLNRTDIPYTIAEASNGEEVFVYLDQGLSIPDVIILDLNMPIKDGRETLMELKSKKEYRHIPVVIMSTSKAPSDVSNAYDTGANMYLVKPHAFKDLIEMLTCLLVIFTKYMPFATRSIN
jgi:CheY-like chemotaxis protein